MDGVKTAERGYRRLEQDSLDWPTRPHHDSGFPIPDSGFPNSEFRMAYGESGIPHHETLGPGGAPGRAGRGPRGGRRGGGGPGMSNANSGVGHSMS